MTTDITELAPAMKAAAEKASGGDWVKESGDGWDATCSNDDQANSGFIIAHFVGPDAAANREFVQAANPANVLALVEALESEQRICSTWRKTAEANRKNLEKAQKSNEFLKGQFSELANFNPDWDKLEASYDSWREIAAELLVAKERIAELEAQPVQPCEHSMFWDASGVKRCSKCDMPEHANVHYADAAEMEIAALRQRIAELESFRTAYMEWSDKTDWVNTDRRFGVVKPLGKHRADVLKAYIEHLESRTVTVKLSRPGFVTISGERTAVYLKADVDAALAAAGIKWEAE